MIDNSCQRCCHPYTSLTMIVHMKEFWKWLNFLKSAKFYAIKWALLLQYERRTRSWRLHDLLQVMQLSGSWGPSPGLLTQLYGYPWKLFARPSEPSLWFPIVADWLKSQNSSRERDPKMSQWFLRSSAFSLNYNILSFSCHSPAAPDGPPGQPCLALVSPCPTVVCCPALLRPHILSKVPAVGPERLGSDSAYTPWPQSFLICIMGMIMYLSQRVVVRVKFMSTW